MSDQKYKDMQEFLDSMEDYNPAIPDQIISYYLQQSGFKTTDKRVLRLVSLSAHKFLAEICKESHGFCARRTAKQQGKEPRYVLATEDLYHSLKDYGINIQKPEYYSDSLANELVQTRSSSSSMMSNMPPSSTPQNGSNPSNE
ncbi:predicted protein [Naegleria gruberi]|uniref:Predicted protein n=1 Tax=Naegleria gruberi TaxID=5762 RepID=D2VRR4_NAEGR|nr:uncharacterized protein NAEGRDRAFT_71677 [Naegleria gruberi]EFC40508.1 predicted protein [Naegleria gruberi]|eukprot:XP_002673252.1 predicted protein [Naegleria gruberi strain NEG-M]